MKYIVISLVTMLICSGIGSIMGNRGGGFLVGVVLAIMLVKRMKSSEVKESDV